MKVEPECGSVLQQVLRTQPPQLECSDLFSGLVGSVPRTSDSPKSDRATKHLLEPLCGAHVIDPPEVAQSKGKGHSYLDARAIW